MYESLSRLIASIGETFHYTITFVFFMIVLINIISLTLVTVNMGVSSSNTNAATAKNLMISAQVIAYVGIASILVFLGVAYSYSSKQEDKSYYDYAFSYTGADDVYMMMRIVTFSILMFISIVVSALCFAAAEELNNSDDPSQYTDQYNTCRDLGRMFFLHFVLFSSIQGIGYIVQIFRGKNGSSNNKEIEEEEKEKERREKKVKPPSKASFDWFIPIY